MGNYKDLLFEKSIVNGEWISNNAKKFNVYNPANNQVVGEVFDFDRTTVKKAINAANSAFESWKNTTAKHRSALLLKWRDLILENKEALSTIMSLESGKPITESRGEVEYGASYIQWFAEECKRNNGITIPSHAADKRISVIKQPVGVVATLTPWNFPLAMLARKIAPAVSVGCTVVSRPSELTPFTAIAIVHLAQKAGFPPGVINVIVSQNASDIGKELCENPMISKLSFTGSTRVGKILMQQSSNDLKRLSLELGGNAPFIVFKDADIDKAVEEAIAGKFRFSGQTCVCVNRFYIEDDVYDEFVQKFKNKTKQLKIGEGINESTKLGPLITKQSTLKMEEFVEDATNNGGKIVLGGKRIEGQFFEPTIINDCNEKMRFTQEEIFGPIAPLYRFNSEQEVVAKANNTDYGLASYVFTNDLNRSIRMSESLAYGMVGMNTGIISTEVAPFGGIKHSGQGREGSVYGLDDYTEIKYICTGNID